MLIPIVQTGDPVLRQRAKELSLQEVRSVAVQELIEHMRETMRAAPGVGLAAPQIGRSIRLIVIEDPTERQAKLSQDQLTERERVAIPFHVLINPRLKIEGKEKVDFFEGCLSVDGYTALTPRYRKVRVDAWNEKGSEISVRASGWYARILQHEIDHINGVLYIDRMISQTFSTVDNRDQ